MKIKKTTGVTTKKASTIKASTKGSKKLPQVTAPVAKTATPVEEKAPRNGVNIGKSTGMRVMAFQDLTLARNDEPKYRLTDTELAKLWREEFPNSRAVLNGRINEEIVRGVRNLYNQGTQGHGTPGTTHQSKPYVVENGKRVTSVYTRARKPVAEAEAAPVVEKKAKGPKIVKGKVVVRRKQAA